MNQNKYSFTNKWHPEFKPWGFTAIPNLLIIHQRTLKITNGELVVLLNLNKFKWDDRDPFPSAQTLSKNTGMSVSSIRKHIRSLEKKKLVKRNFRKSQTNEYSLNQLNKKLLDIASNADLPVKKRSPRKPETNWGTYPNIDTKEDAANKTQRRKRNTKENTFSARDILVERYGMQYKINR